jgi:hypothetical protein
VSPAIAEKLLSKESTPIVDGLDAAPEGLAAAPDGLAAGGEADGVVVAEPELHAAMANAPPMAMVMIFARG